MLLLGEGSEATEPYNKYNKIRPHSIRPCNSIKRFDLSPFDQKNLTYLQPPKSNLVHSTLKFELMGSNLLPCPRSKHFFCRKNFDCESSKLYRRRVWRLVLDREFKTLKFWSWSRMLGPGLGLGLESRRSREKSLEENSRICNSLVSNLDTFFHIFGSLVYSRVTYKFLGHL